jgi:hypothetical protein
MEKMTSAQMLAQPLPHPALAGPFNSLAELDAMRVLVAAYDLHGDLVELRSACRNTLSPAGRTLVNAQIVDERTKITAAIAVIRAERAQA